MDIKVGNSMVPSIKTSYRNVIKYMTLAQKKKCVTESKQKENPEIID